MSDLVQRLRARKGFFLNGSRYNMATTPDTDCAEAADEIERLRHELHRHSMMVDSAEEIVCVCGHVGSFSTHPANGCGFGPFVPKSPLSTGGGREP